ncbi:carbamoyl phosphate synthase-like protein [Gimesia panareensis]|uniref:Carbamoyl phosphate synthase-like protein n=1 Tax=Gimesia panareensis TaxID=2527978 RepID=A0A518FUF9_9PLAN|nr:ATP-grasp domain-containing protein [Gimesia panareensis]QDV19935.1 carbamoyl phosphate synthase-like protein [Gimesia panareensis]
MSLNVFVSEYLCSGGCSLAEAEPSLLAEGLAMLEAVLSDLLKIPDIQVQTCVQEGLLTSGDFQQAEREQRLQLHRVRQPELEIELFHQACQRADVAWVIAPEFDDLLVSRTRLAQENGTRVVGPDLETIQLTADKWYLYQFLNEAGIPVIETELLTDDFGFPKHFPCLIKQRFGAGGLGLERFERLEDWQKRIPELQTGLHASVWQPFVTGKALSVAVLIQEGHCELCPIGEQRIGWESGFVYQGGRIPVTLELECEQAIHKLVNRVCRRLPGLAGYVGFDILLPEQTPHSPLLVEINPRLTTSYTGYRQLTSDNLAERVLGMKAEAPLICWETGDAVKFQADGSFEYILQNEKDERCM